MARVSESLQQHFYGIKFSCCHTEDSPHPLPANFSIDPLGMSMGITAAADGVKAVEICKVYKQSIMALV